MNNLVSIVTPSYNSEKFIEECVNSVLSQSYENWELLIVDDCSKDNSKDIIARFSSKDRRIKSIFLEKNIGAAEARNVAIRKAKGKYIAFLDSDDMWLPQKLEKQIDFMKVNNYAFSFSAYERIEEGGKVLNEIATIPVVNYDTYLKNTIIGCLTVIIDKEKVGEFKMPNIRSSHDMALWLLIMKRGFSAYGCNEVLSKYRVVSSSNTANKVKAAKDVWKVYRQVEKLSFIYSAWCFTNYVFNAFKKRI